MAVRSRPQLLGERYYARVRLSSELRTHQLRVHIRVPNRVLTLAVSSQRLHVAARNASTERIGPRAPPPPVRRIGPLAATGRALRKHLKRSDIGSCKIGALPIAPPLEFRCLTQVDTVEKLTPVKLDGSFVIAIRDR